MTVDEVIARGPTWRTATCIVVVPLEGGITKLAPVAAEGGALTARRSGV